MMAFTRPYTTRAGDLQLVGAPLHVHRATPGVVPMDQRVGQRLSETQR